MRNHNCNILYPIVSCAMMFCAGGLGAKESLRVDLKGQLSSDNFVSYSDSEWQNQSIIRYIPDLTLKKEITDSLFWDLNTSFDAYFDYRRQINSTKTSKLELYRLNSQIKSSRSDFRVGLQKINYGPAILLRSLRWFDQLDPGDPLQRTEAIKGIRYRYFFENNSNLWLWGLYGNDEAKGYELVGTKKHSPEFGARLQHPVSYGEIGFSLHTRKTERTGFTNELTGRDMRERRFALDGRWDYKIGMWFELVSIDQGAGNLVQKNWIKMLSLGADYTFAYGNGLHVIIEHLRRSAASRFLHWNSESDVSAVQFNYPIGLVDMFTVLQIHTWDSRDKRLLIRWTRTYDRLIFGLGVFDYPQANFFAAPQNSGKGIQLTLILNH